ncbi:expressed unknown protein [Seminavis robusta]|uniref:Uncharacterized protein n=1 Tax=Seminavis robusta TaxID=568900 RepID=A0A9N8HV36_9STRA|nr:expressed unknown protein [Seminavis robusta]|eukprot:Sro1737_g294450.1 n/a (612) ;mRNA; f:10513-12434
MGSNGRTDNLRQDSEAIRSTINSSIDVVTTMKQSAPAPPPYPTPVLLENQENQRKLCVGVQNHCFNPEERNVFSPPTVPLPKLTKSPSPAPTLKAATLAPSSDRNDESECKSDEQGNYGDVDGTSFRIVSYRYQVETTEGMTAVDLDVEVLQYVEKSISDLMVQRFFADSCSPPPINVVIPNNSNQQQQLQLQKLFLKPQSTEKRANNGGLRKLLPALGTTGMRKMKTEDHEELVGLSAEPLDQVLEDDDGQACPFPTTTGPCFVVGGGLTMFGDGSTSIGSTGGLLWVDEGIHEELQSSMDSGELEAMLQPYHPEITAIRYIPPGTELPNPPPSSDPDEAVIDEGFIGARSSAWSWVLIGLGFFLMLGVFLYIFISRRRDTLEEERSSTVQAGAFPVVVTKTNVDSVQDAESESPSSRAASTYAEISRYYSESSELILRRNQSDSDDDDDEEGIPLHVFHDDENSPRQPPIGISTSWRDQILRDEAPLSPPSKGAVSSISLDPSQPIVTPILDDEGGHIMMTPKSQSQQQSSPEYSQYHSVNSGTGSEEYFGTSPRNFHNMSSAEFSRYHSAYSGSDAASTLSSSPRHWSPTKHESPSKLKVAFDKAEII